MKQGPLRLSAFRRIALIASFCFAPSLFAGPIVRDQDGKDRDFETDVLGAGPVIINFVYTHCEGVCPGQGRRFELLQKLIPETSKIRLVSLSIDPERDEATDLKHWSKTFHAGKRWTLVRSDRKTTDDITRQILKMTLSPSEHSPFVAIRSTRGQWQTLYGLSSSRDILKSLNELESQAVASH